MTNTATMRTAQDLLAERRANVQELRFERDPMARAMLEAHIAILNAEIKEAQP